MTPDYASLLRRIEVLEQRVKSVQVPPARTRVLDWRRNDNKSSLGNPAVLEFDDLSFTPRNTLHLVVVGGSDWEASPPYAADDPGTWYRYHCDLFYHYRGSWLMDYLIVHEAYQVTNDGGTAPDEDHTAITPAITVHQGECGAAGLSSEIVDWASTFTANATGSGGLTITRNAVVDGYQWLAGRLFIH